MPTILATSSALTTAQSTDLTLLARLRPFIFGPQAGLHRYSQPSERAGILSGYYQSAINTTYAWPSQDQSNSIIDLTYVKVWIQNALLNYFNHYQGIGSVVAPVAGYTNRVRTVGEIFQTANGYTRSSVFGDRDVAIGDVVQLSISGSTLWTTVTGLIPDYSSPVVSAAFGDTNNKATQTESATISQVAGTPLNDVQAAANGAAYTSLADGYITRTYTITVIQGSTGGNATTALLKVTSADGLDNQASITPAAFGSPTTIGTKGLTVTFSIGSTYSSSSLIDEYDFLIGQQWTCTVSQAFTAPTATSGGTFTGPSNSEYIVKVTLGGLYSGATPPQVTVSTTTGIDVSGPTNVSAANSLIPIGNYGTEIEFNGTYLRAGDIYYVPVTAAAPVQVRTLVLKNDLTTALLAASDMNLQLSINVPLVQVAENYTLPSVFTAWTASQSGITVNAGLQLTTAGLTNGGVPTYVPVISAAVPNYGELFIEYREWLIGQADTVYNINDASNIVETLGIIDPDNPIAFAVSCALQNTASAVLANPSILAPANSDVVMCAITNGDPTLTATWSDMLNLAAGLEGAYNLVPLTTLSAVQELVAAAVEGQSTEAVQNYCACLLNAQIVSPSPVVTYLTSTNGQVVLATIAQEPGVSSADYILVSVPAGNSDFITNGVQAGDQVRYQYSLNSFGQTVYNTYTVASVISESSLLLVAGPSGPVSVAQRLEVWHPVTPANVVTQVGNTAASYASSRVCYVWPDTAPVNGVIVCGYYVCAAIAGLLGSVAPHQSVRNVQLLGFDSFPRSSNFLRTSQLDAMGALGVFVCTTDPTGVNYIRWANTTDPSELQTREEMMRRDIDMFVLNLLYNIWGVFVGGGGNTSGNLGTALTSTLNNFAKLLLRTTNVGNLGPAIISATINSLNTDAVNLDQTDANLTIVGATPNNKINLTVSV